MTETSEAKVVDHVYVPLNYQTVKAQTTGDLDERVSRKRTEGWELVGGVSQCTIGGLFMQAMKLPF